MKNYLVKLISATMIFGASMTANAADKYSIDTEGMHAFVQFRVKHLGYSWLYGRFNEFSGGFEYDESTKELSNVNVLIDTESLNTNHAERDKHIRSDDFLNTPDFPTAFFETTSAQVIDGNGTLTGNLTMHGQTQEVTFDVEHIGGGTDPWDGFRQGFQAEATITPADFGINMAEKLGEAAGTVELIISIEGIRE